MTRTVAVLALGLLLLTVAARAGGGDSTPDKKDAPKVSVNDLSMEVAALRTLWQFKMTTEQLKTLRKLADKTAQKPTMREEPAVSAQFMKALQALRKTLVDASDDDAIDEAEEVLETVLDAESPELDDLVEITDEARRQVPEVLRLVKVPQVTAYLARLEDEVVDPLDLLTAALARVRELNGQDYEDYRDDVAERVGWLVAGLQTRRAERLSERVTALLAKSHDLAAAEFKDKRPELEKAAEELVGKISAVDVLRHIVEQGLAQLLSNPRLAAALDARLSK